jgi:hypothetical protein
VLLWLNAVGIESKFGAFWCFLVEKSVFCDEAVLEVVEVGEVVEVVCHVRLSEHIIE